MDQFVSGSSRVLYRISCGRKSAGDRSRGVECQGRNKRILFPIQDLFTVSIHYSSGRRISAVSNRPSQDKKPTHPFLQEVLTNVDKGQRTGRSFLGASASSALHKNSDPPSHILERHVINLPSLFAESRIFRQGKIASCFSRQIRASKQ